MNVIFEHLEQATDEARVLLDELDAELDVAHSAECSHALNINEVFQPRIRFFIVRLDGLVVGCGAVACDDGFAELKRMFIRPAFRGRGLVQLLLARLEAEARAQGFRLLRLETGDRLKAALLAYERAGFARCPAFGEYTAKPAHTISQSVFFEKSIN